MGLKRALPCWAASTLFLCALGNAQVTTGSIYGTVNDPSGSAVPQANITLVHNSTGATVSRLSDPTGTFGFEFLRIGTYTLRIQKSGFKKFESKNIELTAGQTIRQAYSLEVGAVSETVSVEAVAPLVSVASSEQSQNFDTQKVTELPLGRRNVSGVLRLAPGIDIGTGRSPRINGLGASGTGISVDGTDANSNPEQRSIAQYGGRNYIDVMSIDAVQEVQLVRGILPAEYGGVVGGQVNLDFEVRHQQLPWLPVRELPVARVQRAQSLRRGTRVRWQADSKTPLSIQPIWRVGRRTDHPRQSVRLRRLRGLPRVLLAPGKRHVPTAAYRSEILQALPFQEMKILLDTLPMPNVPINEDVGRSEGIRNATSRDNHVLLKGDYRVTQSSNFAITYTRLRPFGLDPSISAANDRTYDYTQDRFTGSYTIGLSSWTSESRFGFNANTMARLDHYFELKDPAELDRETAVGPKLAPPGRFGVFRI